MNKVYLGLGGAFVAALFYLYKMFVSASTQAVVVHTQDEDKSLQQQQLENQQKLAKVNKDLAALYEKRGEIVVPQVDPQKEADEWNTQKK